MISAKSHRIALFFYSLAIIVVCSGWMIKYSELIPSPYAWYAVDQSYRLQEDAFLRGELNLRHTPYNHPHDWVWGDGMQQQWGLGVPLLRLPFHVAGKMVNGFGFPDRMILILFYIIVSMFFWYSLDDAGNNLPAAPVECLKRHLITLPLLLYAIINHAAMQMIRGNFGVYEEPVFYGYFWSLLLLAFVFKQLKQQNVAFYLLTCLFAGFIINIRPTFAAYGGMTFAIVFWRAWKCETRLWWVGLPVYGAGLVFFLVMNTLRFGGPLVTGHTLGLTGSAFFDYFLKFDNPMTWVPFADRARELLHWLFFLDMHQVTSGTGDWSWLADVPRDRDFYFKPFYFIELVLLILAWVFPLGRAAISKTKGSDPLTRHPESSFLALWSFCSFILLFFFYTYFPNLNSRYVVDFAPSVFAGVASLYLYCVECGGERERIRWVLPVGAGVIMILSIVGLLHADNLKSDEIHSTGIEQAREIKQIAGQAEGPPLPDEYNCGDREFRFGIPYNNAEWDISGSCRVSWATVHFFDSPQCVSITVEPLLQSAVGDLPLDQEIEMLIGTQPMKRVSESSVGRLKKITFCADGDSLYSRHVSPIQMISIRWLDLQAHPGTSSPFRLLSVRKTVG